MPLNQSEPLPGDAFGRSNRAAVCASAGSPLRCVWVGKAEYVGQERTIGFSVGAEDDEMGAVDHAYKIARKALSRRAHSVALNPEIAAVVACRRDLGVADEAGRRRCFHPAGLHVDAIERERRGIFICP